MGNPTQDLNQKVLHKYGWSASYDTTEDGCWFVQVVVGFNDTRRFQSDNKGDASTDGGRKKGIAAASEVALLGLAEEIKLQESKSIQTLEETFASQRLDIYESNEENWSYFWRHKPKVVGIDTEGNQQSPPVLLQVSTEDYAILETPRTKISRHVQRLLEDDSIVKVFCDNFSHHDKTCLGCSPADSSTSEAYTTGPIVDLEAISSQHLGPVKVARGLSRIVTLVMAYDNLLLRKTPANRRKSVGRFVLIEQGKLPPLRSMYDLSRKERRYAALDAWCTRMAYVKLQDLVAVEATTSLLERVHVE